jgi:mono/diheme cytochrome c family protein
MRRNLVDGPVTVLVEYSNLRSTSVPSQSRRINPAVFRFTPQNSRYLASTANDGSAYIGPANLFGTNGSLNGLALRLLQQTLRSGGDTMPVARFAALLAGARAAAPRSPDELRAAWQALTQRAGDVLAALPPTPATDVPLDVTLAQPQAERWAQALKRQCEAAAAETGSSQADPAAQIAHGKTLFISYGCGWCHEGGGRKAGKCPQLMGTERDDDFLLMRIATGSAGKMPAFGESLSGPDIQALLAYIRSLKPETTP